MTSDIDAAIDASSIADFGVVVAEMAAEEGLPGDWLNRAATPWVPTKPRASGGVRVTMAAAHELIAMKMAAARAQDIEDLIAIIRHEGITEEHELVAVAVTAYGEESVELGERHDVELLARQLIDAAWRPGTSPRD